MWVSLRQSETRDQALGHIQQRPKSRRGGPYVVHGHIKNGEQSCRVKGSTFNTEAGNQVKPALGARLKVKLTHIKILSIFRHMF